MNDKSTLGVTPQGARNMEALMATPWFEREMDVYRVAIAVAASRGQMASKDEMVGVRTKFNAVGTIDPDGQVRNMITALLPQHSDRPYETAERLANAGLQILASKLSTEGVMLSSALGKDSERAADVQNSEG
jgi:hypothetical protein